MAMEEMPQQEQGGGGEVAQAAQTAMEAMQALMQSAPDPSIAEKIQGAMAMLEEALKGPGPQEAPRPQPSQMQSPEGRPVGPAGV